MSRLPTPMALSQLLSASFSARDDLLLLGETVGRSGGLGGSTTGLLNQLGPTRVIDTPISDRATLGMALGYALAGKTPIVEISASGRIPALMEILMESAAIHQKGEFPLSMVLRVPCGAQAGSRVDASASEILASIDGLRVVCPSSPERLRATLSAAIQAPGVTVILEPRTLYSMRCDVAEPEGFSLESASLARSGDHLTLVTWGSGVGAALTAADALAEENISAAVLDLSSLHPIDTQTLGAWVKHTGRLVCIESPEGGLASHVLRAGIDSAFLYLEAPLAASDAVQTNVLQAARDAVYY